MLQVLEIGGILALIWSAAKFIPIRSVVFQAIGCMSGYLVVGLLFGAAITFGVLGPASLYGFIKMTPKAWPFCFFGIAGAVAAALTFRNWEVITEPAYTPQPD